MTVSFVVVLLRVIMSYLYTQRCRIEVDNDGERHHFVIILIPREH